MTNYSIFKLFLRHTGPCYHRITIFLQGLSNAARDMGVQRFQGPRKTVAVLSAKVKQKLMEEWLDQPKNHFFLSTLIMGNTRLNFLQS